MALHVEAWELSGPDESIFAALYGDEDKKPSGSTAMTRAGGHRGSPHDGCTHRAEWPSRYGGIRPPGRSPLHHTDVLRPTRPVRRTAVSSGFFDWLEADLNAIDVEAPALPFDFRLGWVGYLGYE